ncbi:hypothetical protein QTL86_06655 [Cellulosilyticum sp. ST5]|uniref:hypothetical protein n=1 Tax=unclassified Cellulosilyticum TaxID=2643091 RepID=UPI0016811A22|nr:hypothetical protein [Cellulosilyticum sp. WCF-2]
MNYNNIPIELRELNRWVLYRLTWDSSRGKYDKNHLTLGQEVLLKAIILILGVIMKWL